MGARGVPEKLASTILALRFKAFCVAVETGLLVSEVSSTLVNPTIAFVIPLTVPVKVAPARLALAFKVFVNSELLIVPLTDKLLLNETSPPTISLPVLVVPVKTFTFP